MKYIALFLFISAFTALANDDNLFMSLIFRTNSQDTYKIDEGGKSFQGESRSYTAGA